MILKADKSISAVVALIVNYYDAGIGGVECYCYGVETGKVF